MAKQIVRETAIHGSTGSIGTQTLDVINRFNSADSSDVRFRVCLLASTGRDLVLFERQVREHRPRFAVVADEAKAALLRKSLGGTGTVVLGGPEVAARCTNMVEGGLAVIATSGFAGLTPMLTAIESGNTVAFANKEAALTAWPLIKAAAIRRGVEVLPMDSEPSAMWQCLEPLVYTGKPEKRHSVIWELQRGQAMHDIESLILTCSGGPFRDPDKWPYSRLMQATPEEALNHPTWRMGPLITVRSATLANKAMEVIETSSIFGISALRVDIVIQPKSLVHSGIRRTDGNYILQSGVNDMRHPIAYALSFPYTNFDIGLERLSLYNGALFEFGAVDAERFTYPSLGYRAGMRGGTAPAVLNGADEAAFKLFMEQKIRFTDMAELSGMALDTIPAISEPTLAQIQEADGQARHLVQEFAREHARELRPIARR